MVSFYPGPSRVEDKIPAYTRDAFREGILSMNHRSPEFTALCKKTIQLLRQKLLIPKTYTIFFTSSATECWEILAQSLITDSSIHVYNGAFGEKWFGYTNVLRPGAIAVTFDQNEVLDPALLTFTDGEMICLTQNETSNGTQIDNKLIGAIQKNNPAHLIAVDATSSMAGVPLKFANADIWLASVQKCFGMPAGLGLLILSPKAIERMQAINETGHYNSLTLMAQMMTLWQTSYTPNVMAIYLLMRVMGDRPPIAKVFSEVEKRFAAWQHFFADGTRLKLLITNQSAKSRTVIAVRADPEYITKVKVAAKKNGFLLGGGYGKFKNETFRIANFPALKSAEVTALRKFLTSYR